MLVGVRPLAASGAAGGSGARVRARAHCGRAPAEPVGVGGGGRQSRPPLPPMERPPGRTRSRRQRRGVLMGIPEPSHRRHQPRRHPPRRAESLPMVVLGIDPGLANCGFGVVRRRSGSVVALDGGVLTTRAGVAPERRLAELFTGVDDLLIRHEPDARRARGPLLRPERAHGVRRRAGARRRPLRRRPARHPVRRLHAAAGQGRRLRQRPRGQGAGDPDGPGAARRCRAPPTPDHAADALAVAICHVNHAPLRGSAAAADLAGVR